MPVTFTDEDVAPAQSSAQPHTFTDADVAVDHQEAPGLGQQVSDLFSHTWAGVSGAVGGATSAIRHPLDAIDAAHEGLKRSADEVEKGKKAWAAGDHAAALAHWKLAVPIIGPQAATMREEGERGEAGAEMGDFLGFMAGAKLLHEGGKVIVKTPGAVPAAASGVRTAAGAAIDAVRNPADTVGNLARAVPDVVTNTILPKVEQAATLQPGTADALKILPAGSNIVGAANTIARLARRARAGIQTAQGLGSEAPPVPARTPAGVAYPGAQDPNAVASRAPQIDTSTELSPERLQELEARRTAGQPQVFTEADVAPTAAPESSQPAESSPPKPAELLDEIAIGMAGKPFEKLTAGEQTGVLRVAGRLATKMSPPAAEAPVVAQTPQEVQSADHPVADNVLPVPDGAAAPDAAGAPVAGDPAQPKLLEEPAYDRPLDEQGKPAKTDYQAAARTVKGRAMARVLANPPAGPAITAAEARTIPLGDERWKTIAKLAGVNPPNSQASLDAVFTHMDEIESGRAQMDLGTSTSAPGAQPAPGATLRANGEGNAAARPLETPDQGARSQGVPLQESATPGGEPGAGQTEVEIPGEGRSLPARYRLRELADVQSSHNGLTFQPNPKYALVNDRNYARPENQGKVIEGSGGKFKPAFHITDNPDAVNGPPVVDSQGNAIGGNGRTMQLQRVYAYNPKGAQAYRELLTKKAGQFGINPDDVAKMKQPVLVREIADEHVGQVSHAITDLNKTGTAALTPAERAIADSRRVSPATLDHIAGQLDAAGPDASLGKVLSGEQGPAILKRLVDDGVLSQQEIAAYQSGDKLTPAAKTRISKLMLGRFFRDPAQLDTTPAPIVGKLERLAAPVAKLETAGAWNLTPKLQEALDLIDEARAHSTRNLSEFLKQTGLLGESRYTDDAVTLAKALQRSSGRQLGQAVKDYAATAQYAAEHADAKAGLFGDQVPGVAPTPAEAFDAAFRPSAKSAPAPVEQTPAAAQKPKATKGKGIAGTFGEQFTKD
jgi:hypothetical protein